jgi:uncharacterized tellurite resistance protein B-like protein
MSPTRLFSEIGKLVYSIAAADHKISHKEKEHLKSLVSESLNRIKETDQFGTSVLFYPEIEFEFLEEELVAPEDALQSFVDYLKEHYSAIDLQHVQLIRNLTWETANSFRGINQKEKQMLDKMEEALAYIKNKHIQQLTHHENH